MAGLDLHWFLGQGSFVWLLKEPRQVKIIEYVNVAGSKLRQGK